MLTQPIHPLAIGVIIMLVGCTADSSGRRNAIFVGLAADGAGAPTWISIAPCSVSSRTSRRYAPVPQAASWTRPARGALPDGRSAPRNSPLDLTKECAIRIWDPDRRHSKPR